MMCAICRTCVTLNNVPGKKDHLISPLSLYRNKWFLHRGNIYNRHCKRIQQK